MTIMSLQAALRRIKMSRPTIVVAARPSTWRVNVLERVRRLIEREVGYLREDVGAAVARARALPQLVTPARRSAFGLLVGASAIVYGVAQMWVALAWVLVGVAAIVYGAFLVDLDSTTKRRRARKKKVA